MDYWLSVLIYWLLIHFLIEYTVYPSREEKLYSRKKLLWIQMAIYSVAMLPCMLFVISSWLKTLLAWGLLLIVRSILVCLRYFFEGKNLKPKMAYWLVGIQQVFMVGTLLFVCYHCCPLKIFIAKTPRKASTAAVCSSRVAFPAPADPVSAAP